MMPSLYRIAVGLLFLWPAVAAADPVSCPIQAAFTVAPSHVELTGNSAGGAGGCFSFSNMDNLVMALGTNIRPGTLVLDFGGTVSVLPGDDFAVLTGSFWGELAGATRVEFRLNGELESSIERTLAPRRLFRFNLAGVSANQIPLINIALDLPGVNDLATMSFLDARVTNLTAPTPEPASLLLLGTGAAALYTRKRRAA